MSLSLPLPQVPVATVQPGRPPAGMIAAEAALLTTWLQENYAFYDTVTYNLRVGHGIDLGPDVPDFARQSAIANSQRRIDALLMRGNHPTIVEVKVRATLQAIGQLIGYSVLYTRDRPQSPRPAMLLLCATIDDDTAYVFTYMGIAYSVVIPGAAG